MDRTKILFIEDDKNWLRIFQINVGEHTKNLFDYVCVDTLADAFSAIEKNKFGMILLDLMLPDSHATNTIEIMTEKVKNIPIIIITTLDDEKVMQDAFLLGVEDYLVKDKYNAEIFIHASRQAIKRFLAKETINEILAYLQEIDNNLEQWQKEFADKI